MATGDEQPKKKRGWLFWSLCVVGGLLVIGMLAPNKPNPALAPNVASGPVAVGAVAGAPGAPANGPEITAAEFGQLRTGMTMAQAEAIIGSAGEVQSETDMGGYRTVMVAWKGDGMGNANAMFQNGKMISKAQFGL